MFIILSALLAFGLNQFLHIIKIAVCGVCLSFNDRVTHSSLFSIRIQNCSVLEYEYFQL